MTLVLTYTTTDNQKLSLSAFKCKTHNFKDNVGYVTLKDTYIPAEMFLNKTKLKSVAIPDGVTIIGDMAFSCCDELTSIKIPNSVASIYEWAFHGCTSLTSIDIPNSVTAIGNFAFYNCTRLAHIEIPNSVTSIGRSAFNGCTSLTSIEIPNSVTYIGWNAFYDCKRLAHIEIPNSVTEIDRMAFYGCESLTHIEIPNGVTRIGGSTFSGCKSLPCYKIDHNKRPILAYKGFENDMTCRGFHYEIGKSYHEDKAMLCVCGFHACLNPIDVLSYYPNVNENRFALVELSGKIEFDQMDDLEDDSKIAATDIKIVKELSYEELVNEFNRINNN